MVTDEMVLYVSLGFVISGSAMLVLLTGWYLATRMLNRRRK